MNKLIKIKKEICSTKNIWPGKEYPVEGYYLSPKDQKFGVFIVRNELGELVTIKENLCSQKIVGQLQK